MGRTAARGQPSKRFGGFSPDDEAAIRGLSLDNLEELSEALLDFDGIDNLRQWVKAKNSNR